MGWMGGVRCICEPNPVSMAGPTQAMWKWVEAAWPQPGCVGKGMTRPLSVLAGRGAWPGSDLAMWGLGICQQGRIGSINCHSSTLSKFPNLWGSPWAGSCVLACGPEVELPWSRKPLSFPFSSSLAPF